MKVISFSINGKMAHFRKYYSNSTSLSYIIPPVTTIKGIIAGLLGFERDSYYELFSNDKCKVGIVVEKPIKKITQTMNMLKVENLNDLNGAGKNRTQNNMEYIIPKDIRNEIISYKIIFYHIDDKIMEELENCVCTKYKHYYSKGISLALGSAQCIGWINNGKSFTVKEMLSEDDPIDIYSAIVIEKVNRIELKNMHNLSIVKEETITEFNKERYITVDSKKNILVNTTEYPITVKLKAGTKYYRSEDKNIVFLE